MIYRQIKLILQTKLLLENGSNFKEIEKILKLPYFVVEKIIKQSKKYTFKEIGKSYELLNIADLEFKDSRKEPKIILEELVVNIIKQKIA
jgi:DNA polymerase-3 subunit delta